MGADSDIHLTQQQAAYLNSVLAKAADLPIDRRETFVREACGDDAGLRQVALSRLHKGEIPSPVSSRGMMTAAAHSGLGADRDPDELARDVPELPARIAEMGQRIGQFTIRSQIGSGGFGTVYEAVQDEPRRRVALKLMRRGITSRSALRRFKYEAQLLGRLQHPGIAQIYDAGTHDDGGGGVPYFAIEFVPGARSLTEYIRETTADTRQRLELFAEVCEAVAHGHQKGIIHRDLKPDNILVDSSGRPRIIDFGVARATDSDLAVTTLQTDRQQIIGTLPYMSPEQCGNDALDIDTRSDVYSLGVVLYELLCEQLPYDLSHKALPAAIETIRHEDPAKPSTINRVLRGDVETIVLKALDKDRSRRYRTAADLGDDVRRYLDDEPIVARPPGVTAAIRRFARKHTKAASAIAGAFAVLVVALTVIAVLWAATRVALNESRVANERAAAAALELWESESQQEPDIWRDTRATRLAGEARALAAEADARHQAGDLGQAAEKHIAAVSKWRQAWTTHAQIVPELLSLGLDATRGGRIGDAREIQARLRALSIPLEETDELDDEILLLDLESMVSARLLQPDNPELTVAETIDVVATIIGGLGDIPRARGQSILGRVCLRLEEYDKAAELLQASRKTQLEELGWSNPSTLNTTSSLGTLRYRQRHFDDAERLLRESVDGRRQVLGNDHESTLRSRNNLAAVANRKGQHRDAESEYLEVLAHEQRLGGATGPILQAKSQLAYTYLMWFTNTVEDGEVSDLWRERFVRAAGLLEGAMEAAEKVYVEEPHNIVSIKNNYGVTLRLLDECTRALEQHMDAYDLLEQYPSQRKLRNTISYLCKAQKCAGLPVDTDWCETAKLP